MTYLPSWLRGRNAKTSLTLDEAAYMRWLRAQQPTITWFLGLEAEQQEVLAKLGDDYVQDVCLGIGYAVANPSVAAAGTKPNDPASEIELVQQLAGEAARRLLGAKPKQPPPATVGPTMSGITHRSKVREKIEQDGKDANRSFLGKRPKPAQTPEVIQ